MLVPANKEVHELIDDVKYENGDMSLNLAVNEKYFNEGYDEFEGPVSVDIKNTENDWDITLEKTGMEPRTRLPGRDCVKSYSYIFLFYSLQYSTK